MESNGLKFGIRTATPEDQNFIEDSFKKSLKQGAAEGWIAEAGQGQGGQLFFPEMNRRLEHMRRGRVLVVEGLGPDKVLLGWGAESESTWLHYLYVKQPYRMVGVGHALLTALGKPKQATHWTRSAAIHLKKDGISYWPVYWRDLK